jgi:dihydrofolate synthase/folylpolyglutamate synthase
MASVLRARGIRTGLYTSPHLCSLTERFQVDGRPVAEASLAAAADEVRDVVVAHGLTFFEAATVLAFHLFGREGVEAQVVDRRELKERVAVLLRHMLGAPAGGEGE